MIAADTEKTLMYKTKKQKGYMMETIISKCCICRGRAETVLELPFEDILGMAHDYTQKVGICRKCGFIFTQNPAKL